MNKIKSTFQTLGNLVTAWGGTPSDTKYPSEKLVKTSLDEISTNARTIPQDVSKGANLVVNGSGRMSSNYNFSGFTYLPTICYNGSAGSFGFNGTNSNNEFISCDFNKKIVFSADIRNLVAQPSNCVHRIYVSEYDIDKKSVNAIHVMYGVGTLTELTQDLNPGDTVVHLADLSNANWLSTTTYHRGFIFWNYQNSYGYLYPPETYSRNVYPSGDSNPLWEVANVNVSAGTITLNSGWTGPAIPAGTKVSRRSSGKTYTYPTTVTTGDTEWHSLKGYVKGIVAPGTSERVSTKFSQGTAFIKVGMLTSNLINTDPVTGKRAAVTNFFVYEEQDINDGFGTLPVNRGGTGATTVIGAEYNILNQVADIDTTIDGDRKIALCNKTKSVSDGVFRWLKLSNVWTWIKGLLLSESDVNISGNAATATTAAGYTSGGDIDTALQGKVDKETGMGLSANDFTTAEKDKLAELDNSYVKGLFTGTVTDDIRVRSNSKNETVLSSGDGSTPAPVYIRPLGSSKSAHQFKTLKDGSISLDASHHRIGHIFRDSSSTEYFNLRFLFPRTKSFSHVQIKLFWSYNTQPFEIRLSINIGGDSYTINHCSGKALLFNGFSTHVPRLYSYQDTQYNHIILCWDRSGTNNNNYRIGYEIECDNCDDVTIDFTNSLASGAVLRPMNFVPNASTTNADSGSYSGIGSSTTSVYVDSNGQFTPCKQLVQVVASIDTSNMDSDVLYVM